MKRGMQKRENRKVKTPLSISNFLSPVSVCLWHNYAYRTAVVCDDKLRCRVLCQKEYRRSVSSSHSIFSKKKPVSRETGITPYLKVKIFNLYILVLGRINQIFSAPIILSTPSSRISDLSYLA